MTESRLEKTRCLSDLEWERRYVERDTPWDKGAAAPALIKFLREGQISGRVLVPGCGTGHDVRALGALPETSVVGLDISPTAIARAKELTPSDSTVSFIEGDFFAFPAKINRSFDWLVEHTCFCAIEPSQRPSYVLSVSHALRTGGKIFGIFYLNPDTDSGPPFAVSVDTLSGLFEPQFHLREKWIPKESFPRREGRELVWMMEKR
jgi:SAM-dependent methyltransferase